ncbi:hypothetical protein CONLIGDRAFT_628595 [Coniochaeta ligniaria NRRL 30616]|uniref:Secreted protein n=1 Tax=Coniochaeta ligniaria NRRL 30616 TaxID=1408157 RepID=A0A1J7JUG2_9PEZI|nr:hypothetical protein CONLIGDRAFT_628595 [Coniochaeta ligniaria NRRL 30616]
MVLGPGRPCCSLLGLLPFVSLLIEHRVDTCMHPSVTHQMSVSEVSLVDGYRNLQEQQAAVRCVVSDCALVEAPFGLPCS